MANFLLSDCIIDKTEDIRITIITEALAATIAFATTVVIRIEHQAVQDNFGKAYHNYPINYIFKENSNYTLCSDYWLIVANFTTD